MVELNPLRIYQHEKKYRHKWSIVYYYNDYCICISSLKASGESLGEARKRSYIYDVNEVQEAQILIKINKSYEFNKSTSSKI
mgnify:CR=1 FL=1